MKKWQQILQAMMETAREETAKGKDLREVREAVRQTRDDMKAALRRGITLIGTQGTEPQTNRRKTR
jgi:hypothetical protein